MKTTEKLEAYCKKMLLDASIILDGEQYIMLLDNKEYIILSEDEFLFDEEFDFEPTSEDPKDGFVYIFNGRWYTQDNSDKTTFIELKNVSKAVQTSPTDSFLGIHSGTELLNGLGMYKDWISKAKFLGIKTLGIVEKHTLAGVIDFQSQCESNDIKSIIGTTITVSNLNESTFELKCYAKNFQGWQNLLKFNKIINVDNEISVPRKFVEDNMDGLFTVIDPKNSPFDETYKFDYYQLDSVVFSNPEKDKEYVWNLQRYIQSDFLPVSITDAYYIEEADAPVREVLWNIAKAFDDKSSNQYFKSYDQYQDELEFQFGIESEASSSFYEMLSMADENLAEIIEGCNFKYDTTSRHLPKYKMTPEEAEKYDSNEALFNDLLKQGLILRKISDEDMPEYLDRLKVEINILEKGNVIDYFLVTADIMKFARANNILTGIARGSAGGSLVSYLLNIVQLDPIKLDLLFERFLNEGRMGEMTDCKAYEIQTPTGNITLNEKSVLTVQRGKKEICIFVEDLQKNDLIIKH